MEIEDIDKMLRKLMNVKKRVLKKVYYSRNPYEKELIKSNRCYKDIHKGERCFILGSGPSLKEQPLELLADEYVFTANGLSKYEKFPLLKSNYHVIIDREYFGEEIDTPYVDTKNIMEKLKTDDNSPICFVPLNVRKVIEEMNIQEKVQIQYMDLCLYVEDKYKGDFDFAGPVLWFHHVINCTIALAIYMGFEEIYLLGCEETVIVELISVLMEDYQNEHVFENPNHKIGGDGNMQTMMAGMARLLGYYSFMEEYCRKRNIKLYNCTPKTIVQSVPKKDLSEVLKEKRNRT